MKDNLVEVLEASASRAIIKPIASPSVDLISLRTLTTADIPAIRAFQAAVLEELEIRLVVVGGGYGCTRITVAVVSDSPEEAKRLLAELFSSEALRRAALEANFPVLIHQDPYVRKDLKTGEIEGVLPGQGLLLFYSYSHTDEEHQIALSKHLSALSTQRLIKEWHDRKISPGTEWAGQIDRNLEKAHIILLLISADFLSSPYCRDVEMACALRRHHGGEARVVPVIVRDVDWEGTPIADLQAVPTNGRAVTLWPDRDAAWTNVAKQIRRLVRELRQVA